MSSRRGIARRDSVLAILIILILIGIYAFIRDNWETIRIVLFVLAVAVVFTFGVLITIKVVKKRKLRSAYAHSAYAMETGIPYSMEVESRGTSFEIYCYNRIRKTVGPQFPMLTNVHVPQAGAINKDSQIDIILFHSSGIHVLELKNFSGPLIGSVNDERWIPYIETKKKSKKNGRFEDIFEPNWVFFDRVSGQWTILNPIKQNEGHIATLKKICPNEYLNFVILSDEMFVSERPKNMIDNVLSLDEYLTKLRELPVSDLASNLRNACETIKSYDRQNDPRASLLHNARVTSIKRHR